MDPESSCPASAGFRADDLSIIVNEAAWRRAVPGVEALIRRAALAAGGAGCVVLESDREVRRLNARHRGKDKPTNVLTFEPPVGPRGEPMGGGDIVLAYGVVLREARAAARSPAAHLAHLVVHGALHLRGHDHHHPGEARRMEMEETRILGAIGIANPWRTGGGRTGGGRAGMRGAGE